MVIFFVKRSEAKLRDFLSVGKETTPAIQVPIASIYKKNIRGEGNSTDQEKIQ